MGILEPLRAPVVSTASSLTAAKVECAMRSVGLIADLLRCSSRKEENAVMDALFTEMNALDELCGADQHG